MDEFKIRHGGLPVGLFAAIIVTSLLFIALPLLTQFQRTARETEKMQGAMISTKRPTPPPAEDRDEPKKQEMKQKETQKEIKKVQRAQPKFDAPHAKIGMAGTSVGGIKIGMVDNFEVSDSLFMSAFNLNEVDQKPQVLRAFPPQYPYLAKRDNIEGRIVLKFVVDTDGTAKEPEVVKAEPEEVLDIFSEAALKAVERYKFKPAMKNGKAVLCIVKLPIVFAMED
jgi:protein TonB